MKFDSILIRFGELNTKGKNKQNFIDQLYHNIKKAVKPFDVKLIKEHDRIFVDLNDKDHTPIVEELKNVSGIANMSLVVKVGRDIDAIIDKALELSKQKEKGTFKVVTKRSDKTFPMHSDEINRAVASVILKNTEHKVDVHKPTFKVDVEVRKDAAYIFFDKIKGLGGYPLGMGGKTLVLFSGGIDSPVAAYSMMKRGVRIEAIHFASPPYTSEGARQKVIDLLKILAHTQGSIALHIVPFTKLQEAIYDNADESYAITLMRRMMYRIAEKVANEKGCTALTSGESVGQVASQTLESMATINEVIKIPMIRPLATYDKEEIIEIAKKIKTYDISILPFIDCCTIFTPKNPVTKPTSHKAIEFEEKFDYASLVEECVKNIETIIINENYLTNQEDNKFL